MASFPTSCSSAAWPIRSTASARLAEQHRDAPRQVDDLLGMAVRVVVARVDRGGERVHGGGRRVLALQPRELLLGVGVGDRDAALAHALGQQERAVGRAEQFVGLHPRLPRGDADRAVAEGPVVPMWRAGGHAGTYALGDGAGGLLIAAREDEHELVPAVPRHLVVWPHLGAQRVRDASQQLVAGGMAELVVDALEVVEVDQHAAQGLVVARRAGDLLPHPHLHRAVVEQPRERVGAGGRADVVVRLGVVAGHDGEVGDRLEHVEILGRHVTVVAEADRQRAAQLAVPAHRDADAGAHLVQQDEARHRHLLAVGGGGHRAPAGQHLAGDALAGLRAGSRTIRRARCAPPSRAHRRPRRPGRRPRAPRRPRGRPRGRACRAPPAARARG